MYVPFKAETIGNCSSIYALKYPDPFTYSTISTHYAEWLILESYIIISYWINITDALTWMQHFNVVVVEVETILTTWVISETIMHHILST